MKAVILTTFALVAFAMNSLLCRMALGAQEIDAASFTAVRLLSGAVVLAIIVALMGKTQSVFKADNGHLPFFYLPMRSVSHLRISA